MGLRTCLAAVVAAEMAAGLAVAAPTPPAPDAAAAAARAGAESAVTSYPLSFFADKQPSTALDMVGELPGFAMDGGDASRGFASSPNVLIDGERPATKNDSLDEVLKRIPASSVARIDVIRGGAPGIDMHGKTVIANIVRKTDEGLKLVVVGVYNPIWNGRTDWGTRLEASKRSGQTSYEAGLLLVNSPDDGTGNGPHTVTTPAGALQEQTLERAFGNAGVKKFTGAVEAPLAGGRLRAEGSFLDNHYTLTVNDLSPVIADRQRERFGSDQATGEMGLRYNRSLGERLKLEAYALQQLGSFVSNDALASAGDLFTFDLKKRTGESIVRGTATYAATPTLSIESGLEGDYNWLTSRTRATDAGVAISIPAANVHVTELRGEVFSDATWQARSNLTAEIGARIEASQIASTGDVTSTERFVFPKPRAVVTWSPNPANQLQLRVEREVGQLNFDYFAASGTLISGTHAGNPSLNPQQDWVVEATYDRRFWNGGDASLTLRHYWLADAIDFAPSCVTQRLPVCDPALEFDTPANIGNGSKDELAASLTLPTDKLGLKDGLLILRSTWRHSHVIDPSTHRAREISGLHPVDAEAHYTQGLPSIKSVFVVDVFSAWRGTNYHFNEVDTQRLGWWLSMYLEYRPRPDLSVKLEADNLLTHGVEQVRAFYSPFRDVGGGMLTSIDTRSPRFGPYLQLRARKTFG